MKRKVKINKLPQGYMQQGGSVNKTLSSVPRDMANLEAEKGEVAMLKSGGEPMTFNIGGKRHSEGGTPLNLEPGSRIFSDTRKMKIKDKEILAQFGATKAATPAKLAKKYDVNDYQASLANPFADDIEKNTARMMINKNEEKLNDLFFVQEAKKGFPQGVPGQQMNQEGLPMAQYGVSTIGYIPSAKKVNAETIGINAGENEYLKNLRNGEEPMTEAEFAAASQGSGPVLGVQDPLQGPRTVHNDASVNGPRPFSPYFVNDYQSNSIPLDAETQSDKYDQAVETAPKMPGYTATGTGGDGTVIIYENDQDGTWNYLYPDGSFHTYREGMMGPKPNTSNNKPSSTFTPSFTSPSLSLGTPGKSLSDSLFGKPGANFPQAPQLPFDTAPYQVTSPVSTETSPAPSSSSSPSSSNKGSGTSSAPADPRMMGNKRLYEGSREKTPTGKSNRFSYDQELFDSAWSELIPGFSDLDEAGGQSATYDYILANDPDRLREMWAEWGNTKKGRAIPGLEEKYPDGIIDGASLTEQDLIELKEAYVDGMYGDRQMFPQQEPATEEVPEKTTSEMEIPQPEEYRYDPAKPFEQDLRNERVLGRNRMSERLRLPWRGRLAARTADPTYQSDVQQQQNLLAGLNTAAEAASAFGANPGAVMSNIARMSGLTGNQSNQIAAALQRENTNIANQFEQFNSQQQAATDVRNMANAQDLYDNTIKAQEVFDEKMRRYNLMQTAAKNATDTNLARINTMNKLNPDFNINVGKGPQYGDLSFVSDVARARQQGLLDQRTQSEQALAAYQSEIEAINKLQGLTEDHRSDLLKQAMERYQGYSAPKKGATNSAQDLMTLYNQMMPMVDPRGYYGNTNSQQYNRQNPYGTYQWGGKKKY